MSPNLVLAVSLLADLAQAGVRLSMALQGVSGLIAKAQAEGRDLTDEEMTALAALDDVARADLEAAIAEAKAKASA